MYPCDWAHVLAITLFQYRQVGAFNIVTPVPGEVIDVAKIYNLTWTVDGFGPEDQVETIEVESPGEGLLSSGSSYYYLQGFGSDEDFNISAASGNYGLNLTNYWSPIYNELPTRMWNISLTVSGERSTSTRMNDTVQIYLVSSKTYPRPILPPIRNFQSTTLQVALDRLKPSSGILQVVLSIVIPFMLISVIGLLCRYRRTHHKYESISRVTIEASDMPQDNTPPTSSVVGSSKGKDTPQVSSTPKQRRTPFLFVLSALVTLVPLIALLVALFSLLYMYKVEPAKQSRPDFASNQSIHNPTVFFVDYDATRYTTIASWTSSIALLLPGFLTTLIWHYQSQRLEQDTKEAKVDNLLTPYQLSLLLNLKSGTLGSLWDYLQYICSRRREKQARFLFDAGFIVLISTLLGLGIWVADTWLHVTTSTVPFSRILTASPLSSLSYGRQIWRNCSSDPLADSQDYWSCALVSIGLSDVPPVLVDGFAYASIISGRDDVTAIKFVTLGSDRMAYVAPADIYPRTDYRANTVAVRSFCENIDKWCIIPQQNGYSDDASAAHCGKFVGLNYTSADPIYNGTTVNRGVVSAVTSYFTDQNWTNILTVRNASNSFFTVTRLDSTVRPTFYGLPAYGSTSAATGTHFSSFLGCHTEFVNFTYTFANEAIVTADIAPLHNTAVANAVLEPAMMAWNPFLNSGAASTMTARSVEIALENWIDTLHLHHLPFVAIVMDEVENIAEQGRYPILVARIPKAPLFTLATLLVLSIAFNSFILIASLWRTNLARTHRKQLAITVAGLAASKFEDTDAVTVKSVHSEWQLFTESHFEVASKRVGLSDGTEENVKLVSFVSQSAGTKFSS